MADTRTAALVAILGRAPVVPVLTIARIEHAVPLARALASGGLTVLEVTMRTTVALEAVRRIKGEVRGVSVGAGTVLSPADLTAAVQAGADFLVSPGATATLLDAAGDAPRPLLPGAATASESMTLLERGYTYQKFFPAEASGGPAFLKALRAPLPAAIFCPTGGITAVNAPAYLALANVICVGASWPADEASIRTEAWDEIASASRLAAQLPRHRSSQTDKPS